MTSAEVVPATAAALAFVDDLDDPTLDVGDHHHLTRVLRLAEGTVVVLADGAGRWRPARLALRPDPSGDVVQEPAPAVRLTVAFAPVKGDRPEWVVQKLTELGVDEVQPLVAARSVVRWDAERGAKQVERWRRVARGAAMQCRRTWLPVVAPLCSLDEAARRPGASFADASGEPPDLGHPTVLIGPEGGWTPAELDRSTHRTRLGDHVLRAETAAVTAAALLAALRAGLTTPIRNVR